MSYNPYETLTLDESQIEQGLHRAAVGGLWDEMGRKQTEFLIGEGLKPEMKLLDIGCGCLRAGIHLVQYLNAGNYFGMDMNASLLKAGYEIELRKAGLQHKLPRRNLLLEADFRASRLGVRFDMMMAQSVFTHMPLNPIRRCLIEVAKCLKSGGRLYATFFEAPKGHPLEEPIQHANGEVTTHMDRDPFHYRLEDFCWLTESLPLEPRYIGDWGHAREQKMLMFVRN